MIYRISVEFHIEFFPMYACTGLWCQFFLILYACTELSNVMRYATRSTEEIFSLFIGVAFVVESLKAMQQSECVGGRSRRADFEQYFYDAPCTDEFKNETVANVSTRIAVDDRLAANASALYSELNATFVKSLDCRRDTSILYMLLM